MKKLLSLILTISMLLSAIPVFADSFSDVEDSEAIDVVTGLGIMNGNTDGTFLPDDNLTRADFAQIIANIYHYGSTDDGVTEWKQSFFEGVLEETDLIPEDVMNIQSGNIFDDVSSGSDTYKAIELVYSLGIMVGVGDRIFEPDGNVTVEQALKVILTMMGYGYRAALKGGYPNGYRAIASEKGLTEGITDLSKYATRQDIAQILYNALDVELMQLTTENGKILYKEIKGDTFLTKLLDIDSKSGRITNNGNTSLSEAESLYEDFIIVNNQRYMLNDDTQYAAEYIGRSVKYYYSVKDDNYGDLIYVRPDGKDEAVTFDINDFEKYENSQITYSVGNRKKTVNLKSTPFVIKNGAAVSKFSADDFKFNYGTVTVVKPQGENRADLIIIRTMQNFNIDSVDLVNQKMYSSTSPIGKYIDINTDKKRITVYNSIGEKKGIEALYNGAVTTICYGETTVDIYISEKVEQNIKAESTELNTNDEYVIHSGDKEFVISKDYADMGREMPKLGQTYKFKLDYLGKIVGITDVSSDYGVAFMNNVRSYEENVKNVVRISYFDMSTSKYQNGYLAQRVKITNTDDSSSSYNLEKASNAAFSILDAYIHKVIDGNNERIGGIFRYKTNDDGEFTEIELAGVQEDSNDDSSRLVEIKLDENAPNPHMYNGNSVIGGKAIVTDATKFLRCDYRASNFDSDKGYSFSKKNEYREGGEYDMRLYSTVKNSPVVEYAVHTADAASGITIDNDQKIGIITDMYEGLNDDDEAVTFVKMGANDYEIEDGVFDIGKIKNMQGATYYTDGNGVKHDFVIEIGDIIRYAANSDGQINEVQLLYDSNADYSSGITINSKVYSGFSKHGNIAGCIDGYYEDVYANSNPFSKQETGDDFATDAYAWSYYNGNMRVMIGSVLRAGSGYITTTTRNLKENPGTVTNGFDGVYTTNLYDRTTFTLVTVSGNNVTVSTNSTSDLRSYLAAGDDCDKIIITSRLGRAVNAVVYRYE